MIKGTFFFREMSHFETKYLLVKNQPRTLRRFIRVKLCFLRVLLVKLLKLL